MRYFAALAVVITHVNPHYVASHLLRDGAYYGFVGVSFFYLLSGFVLTWSCSTQAPTQFWWNRFSRVWPLMATMMVAAYLFFWQLEKHPSGPFGYSLQAFLLQSWDPNPRVYAGGDGPVWSLSCEMFFYTMFPLIVLAVRRMRARGLVLTAAAVIAAMTIAPIAAGPHVSPSTYMWLFFYLPGYRIGEFIIGMLVARAVALGLRFKYPSIGYLLGCAGLAVWIIGITRYTLSHNGTALQRPFVALLAMPCFVLLLFAGASADLGGRTRVFGMWLPVRLGEWSFALYLVHPLTAAVVGTHHWLVATTAAGGFGYLAVFLVATTAVAAAAHYALEKPVERWLRRHYPGRGREAGHRKVQARTGVLAATPAQASPAATAETASAAPGSAG
jgi:peptidoglycan/LPS O-acetylase OafA/YrhL